ncbi:unnamed protein product [Citrullus colocynthis]|uniref:Uncharacterized protein n=1 Tax=Citrullus colocynthis TaxID=252529 RepID=A0ABP0YS90_9ROSI
MAAASLSLVVPPEHRLKLRRIRRSSGGIAPSTAVPYPNRRFLHSGAIHPEFHRFSLLWLSSSLYECRFRKQSNAKNCKTHWPITGRGNEKS